jgi:hypothetical protein
MFVLNVYPRLLLRKWPIKSIFFPLWLYFLGWVLSRSAPPSVLASPIPPWGTPSAAGVAEEHSVPPIHLV